ncbi:cytochrome o ubiquinol oxidase subunit IV [Peristeroidobacter soli]|jgi:cytochrome o ubiquinol oxidase operon protein cyoD|uniref:cytochrome o ubiquinol oxidase subunit IV n=1 Tax=Peristeroidobacter soli TaxID=2497877 RepID=UPI00101BB6F9|nr:cytochrome o ubiquinol oxidase subunit IV [Peristeroidobacter soli]
MSAHDHASDHEAGLVHGEEPHGTLKEYLTGFILSVILTAIPFYLLMGEVSWSKQTIALTIVVLAAVQMVVHMVYFLHMTPKSEDGWTLTSLVFTLILVVITLAGSLWVMYHMDTNMMPKHEVSQPR